MSRKLILSLSTLQKHDQLMGGSMSWLDAQEKHQVLHQMFIETLNELGGVVVDDIALTSSFS